MPHQILLYISAGTDLAVEREVLGRAITEIPLDLGWRIFQSPGRGSLVDREAVELADIHLFLMGSDIQAPVGYEWDLARRAERWPIPLLKRNVSRTPAAHEFIRYVRFQSLWFPFDRSADLRRRILRLLSAFILFKSSQFKLSLIEIETLKGWRQKLSTTPVNEKTIGGAGESGVLLTQARYVPIEGVKIQKPEEKKEGPWPDIDLDWLELGEEWENDGTPPLDPDMLS